MNEGTWPSWRVFSMMAWPGFALASLPLPAFPLEVSVVPCHAQIDTHTFCMGTLGQRLDQSRGVCCPGLWWMGKAYQPQVVVGDICYK